MRLSRAACAILASSTFISTLGPLSANEIRRGGCKSTRRFSPAGWLRLANTCTIENCCSGFTRTLATHPAAWALVLTDTTSKMQKHLRVGRSTLSRSTFATSGSSHSSWTFGAACVTPLMPQVARSGCTQARIAADRTQRCPRKASPRHGTTPIRTRRP